MPVIDPGGQVITGGQRRVSTPLDKSEGGLAGAGLRWAKASYSFAADGGAVGTLALIGRTDIPSGSYILGGFIDVTTPLTSGGAATVALQVEGAGDLQAAAAVSGAPWSTAGRKSVVPNFTGANIIKLTAARDISAVIATAALTAGAFDVYVAYLPPSD